MAKHSVDDDRSGERTGAAETIRSEERLLVGRQRVPSRIARVEKHIVTEQRTITVEVRHEEVRVVYEDLPEDLDGRGLEGPRELPELVLHEERIEVVTRTVPVERVRPVIVPVTEQREVTGDVRLERVEIERSIPDTEPARRPD